MPGAGAGLTVDDLRRRNDRGPHLRGDRQRGVRVDDHQVPREITLKRERVPGR
jgi:hypothetical protein